MFFPIISVKMLPFFLQADDKIPVISTLFHL